MNKVMKLKTKYGDAKKCICGCEEFRAEYKYKSYLFFCVQCGMFCGQRKKPVIIEANYEKEAK